MRATSPRLDQLKDAYVSQVPSAEEGWQESPSQAERPLLWTLAIPDPVVPVNH